MTFDYRKFLADNKITNVSRLDEDMRYGQYFYDDVGKLISGKSIGDWKVSFNGMSGVLEWSNRKYPNLFIAATPFWEGSEGIPGVISNDFGAAYYKEFNIPWPKDKVTGDPKKDALIYLNFMKKWFSRNALGFKKMNAMRARR